MFHKDGLEPIVRELDRLGVHLYSTGGTQEFIEGLGVKVTPVEDLTTYPSILGGRVKTLHPKVHGGLLGRPDLSEDAAAIAAHGIVPFELVVVNLYPFQETIAKPNVTLPEAIEQIDIGGPSMIRSASKNHAYVGVVTQPSQFDAVLAELQAGQLSLELRRKLAAAAFEMTAKYDRAIADYLAKVTAEPAAEETPFPTELTVRFHRQQSLRYGE
ncbi:MAG: bifunctional phosphoribosylaminoimidazolecarboxamide formyltransferase/IMP cyclohydrolase PurH, partial [Flavobacteriales bacterium]|nr:bifunctional phosphoribosylaminoimidazolecarboxamide formyltransferase/IMP cyclohydrolase PurH [Flavobacteriales bacterium]